MECPNCKKPISIPNRVYRNLETYSPAGMALSVSDCCGIGFVVKSTISFKITLYTGEKTEDDWGEKIKKVTL